MARIARCTISALVLVTVCGQAAQADAVKEWNQATLNAIAGTSTPPPRAARALAMVHGAVYDAVNSIDRQFQPYLVDTTAAAGTSREAAAAAAAFRVASTVFASSPAQVSAFQTLYDNQIAAISDSPGKSAGIALGQSIGSSMLAARSADGSTNPGGVTFPGSTDPGRWRPAADNPAAAALPFWGNVQTFAIPTGASFRPANPPTIGSAEYATAFNEVKQYGGSTSSLRTADQTNMARAWVYGAGTVTPPGAWNLIAQSVAGQDSNGLTANARTFAMLNIGLADAAIAAWDSKYNQDMWRPVDAIRQANLDGNAATDQDATWLPLLSPTPNHPTYVSGHSTFSRAGAEILKFILGTDSINLNFAGDSGLFRQLTSLDQAANEGGMSRIYGGIHFQFDNTGGQEIGRNVASFLTSNYFQVIPAPGAGGLLAIGGVIAFRRRR